VVGINRERDAAFERLLRRTLTGGSAADAGACPDADTLAAFSDAELPPDERVIVEAHAAVCDRCRATLAAMVRAYPAAEGPVIAGWRRWLTGGRVRWLVPVAGTAAVCLAAYVALRPDRVERAGAPASPKTYGMPLPVQEGQRAEMPKAMIAPAPPEATTSPASDRTSSALRAAKLAADQKALADKSSDEEREALLGKVARGDVSEKSRSEAPLSRQAPAPSSAPAPARSEVDSLAAARERTANSSSASMLERAEPLVVRSPGGAQWRLGLGSAIERSSDGGRTWRTVLVSAKGLPLAASAPSETVCWVVGTSGTIFLTTDGETWQSRLFPEAADLVQVLARDATYAIVTTRDNRRFVTTDGGATWVSVGNPP
jgi:hypothetical protein